MILARRWLPTAQTIRVIASCLAVLCGLLVASVFIHQLILPLLALIFPQLRPAFFDIGVYGGAPAQTYFSTDLQSPELSILEWQDTCDDGGQIFLGPYGKWVESKGPTILSARGDLIWTTTDFELALNFRTQEYRGERYLTFWSGHKEGAKGQGAVYMLNNKYETVNKIQAVGEGLFADLHEAQFTDDGTALITVYNDTTTDMRDFGFFRGEHGWVTDCGFQEIDIETNELLFQWMASDHVRTADTRYVQPSGGFSESEPFDYYHINSVEKDSKGNYLISSRHFHTISYIEGGTGNVLWRLGADSADFVDISDTPGAATRFRWSHDARWIDEEAGIISLFDNGNAGPLHLDHWTSKGMTIQINRERRTVKLLQDFAALYNVRAHSQGNMQYLPDKDEVLIGWGGAAMWTQQDMDGEVLCEVHYGPVALSFFQKIMSYRVFKSWGWKGDPQWPPSASINEDELFVSWNGATEVASWRLEGSRSREGDDDFETIVLVEKTGFETAIELPAERFSQYRAVALDESGRALSASPAVAPNNIGSLWAEWLGRCTAILLIVGLVGIGLYLLVKNTSLALWLPRRQRAPWFEYRYSKL